MASERILIEGIGGIGGVVAAKLIAAGYAPVLVTNNPAITTAIQRDGLRLTTPEGSTSVQATVYTTLGEVPADQRFDAAYLIMKANGVIAAAGQTLPLLKTDGYLVTFQNGLVEDAVAAVVGTERVIGATVGWGGTMHSPGVYEKTSPGATHIGELDGHISERVQRLGAALEHSAPVEISANMRGVLWSKLALNCAITTMGAVIGETIAGTLSDARLRRLCLRAYAEVVDTAEAHGITLERIAANPKLLYLKPGTGGLQALIKDLIVRYVGRKYGRVKASMLQSLERGRKTEIDFLNGYAVRKAAEVGIAAPVNAALTTLIQEIEDGTRQISKENIADLLQMAG